MEPVALATRVEMDGDVAVLHAEGDVDLASADAMKVALAGALEQSSTVVVDLGDVGFIDSTGLSALIWGHGQAQEAGGSLRLRRPTPMLRRLLEITALESVLVTEDSDDSPGN
jgi:anti-sigma B factor antagonist